MKEYIRRYFMLRRHNMKVAIKKAKMSKMCYAFLAPYAIIFALFYILPVITSIFYSFTYYNILESPKFVGLQNYINLILQDDVFLIGVKNTFVIAVITGPLGYIASFLFALFSYDAANVPIVSVLPVFINKIIKDYIKRVYSNY